MSRSAEDDRSYLILLARAHLHRDLRGRLDASDLVQQTLLEAHRDQAERRGQSPAERAAWLRRILANKMLNAVRDQRRLKRDRGRERSLDDANSASERLASRLAAPDPSPSELMQKQEQFGDVARAIAELTEDQQQVLVLRFFDGCTLNEIAEHMARSPPAVAGLLYRSLNEMERKLRRKELP